MTPAGPGRCLDCAFAPLDTTCSGRGRHFPSTLASSRPEPRPRGGAERPPRHRHPRTDPAFPNGSGTPGEGSRLHVVALDTTRGRRGGLCPKNKAPPLRTPRHVDRRLDGGEPKWRHLHGPSIPERFQHSRTAPARPGRCLDFTSFRSTRPEAGGGGRFIINASSLMRRRRCECRGLPAPAPSARASRGASPRRGAPLD